MKRRAYFIPFQGCTRRCVYCDQNAIAVGAGTFIPPLSPETVKNDASAEKNPVEICFFGGSFAHLPEREVARYLDAVRHAPEGSRATFSSYPGDFEGERGEKLARLLRSYPIGTIELGVPSLDPLVLRACGRDDDPEAVKNSIRMLRDAGFHIGVQIMTGLPGQSDESSMSDVEALAGLMPEGAKWHLRIYPCLVLRGTALERLFAAGEYAPQTLDEAVRLSGRIIKSAESNGFRAIRVGLLESAPLKDSVVAGPYHPAFGELAFSEMLALELSEATASGPWTVPKNKMSWLTGHKKHGLRRLAELTGNDLDRLESKIFFV